MWRAVNGDAKSSSAAATRFIYTASNNRLTVSDLYLVSKRNQMVFDWAGLRRALVQLRREIQVMNRIRWRKNYFDFTGNMYCRKTFSCSTNKRGRCTTPCLKNVLTLACYNFDTRERMLIFFGRNVTDKVSNQKTLFYAS